MKTLVLLLAMLIAKLLLADDALPLLKGIESDAIVIGDGPTDAYAVIDPQCLRSRDFLEAITANDNLRRMYRYHLYLYNMPQVDSASIIRAIYNAPSPKTALLEYMLDFQLPSNAKEAASPEVRARILRIKTAADHFGMTKTPLLKLDRPDKK